MLLIISKNIKIARSIANSFHYMSILSYASTPHNGMSEISSQYNAVLIIDPESIADIRDYVDRLRSYSSEIPIFSLINTPSDEYKDIFEESYTANILSPAIAENIIDYANRHHIKPIGHYSVGGFYTSCDSVQIKYFDTPLNLTRTEANILRYLIHTYPTPRTSSDILKYSYKSDTAPNISTVKTHISKMNNNFRASFGYNMLEFVANEGYLLSTPKKKIKYCNK